MPSDEVRAIIDYIEAKGIPYRVTATVGRYVSKDNPCSPHTASSLHCAPGTNGTGLAVDFGGVVPGVNITTVEQMTGIFLAFKPAAPQLAELFYNGPGISSVVKNGVWRNGPATLGVDTWLAHRSHLHVAVHRGTFLVRPTLGPTLAPKKEVKPMFDPPLQVVDFLGYLHGSGGWALLADGGIAALGDAPYRGPENQPFGHDYWGARKAARLERHGEGYDVISTANERYQYP